MASYVLEGPKWGSGTITWSFATTTYAFDSNSAFSSYITQAEYQSLVEQAFAAWAAVANVTFEEVTDSSTLAKSADIRIGFGDLATSSAGEIGNVTYYSSGTTFLPDVVIRLEDPAYVTLLQGSDGYIYANTNTALYQVILHEIGHALGLGHNTDQSSTMYPVATELNRTLDATDIAGIQALYGVSATTASATASSAGLGTSSSTSTNMVVATGTITLQGSHDQYIIAATQDGALYIQDNVSGRDGSVIYTGATDLQFTDGSARFDADGSAETIDRLYLAAFGRNADVSGLDYWVAQVSAGENIQTVADGFAASDEFATQLGGDGSDAAFVQALYQKVLDRSADTSGQDYWTNSITSGETRGQVLLSFAQSSENISNNLSTTGDVVMAEVYRVYKAALDRAPDATGLAYWTSAVRNGEGISQVADTFLSSSEYQNTYGGLSVSSYVTALYQNVLGRTPDSSGLSYWSSTLTAQSGDASSQTRAQVLMSFADSLENRVQTASDTHANWVFLG